METFIASVLMEQDAVRLPLVLDVGKWWSCLIARESCGRDDGEGRERGRRGDGDGDGEVPSFAMDSFARTYVCAETERERERERERGVEDLFT